MNHEDKGSGLHRMQPPHAKPTAGGGNYLADSECDVMESDGKLRIQARRLRGLEQVEKIGKILMCMCPFADQDQRIDRNKIGATR